MIKSKYFPTGEECVSDIFNFDFNVEVPSDVYDSAVAALEKKISNGEIKGVVSSEEAKKIILRGEYPYEVAKIIAKSEKVEALKFNEINGEIFTTSSVSISTEMNFAFATWNFYDKESAIDRVILSWLANNGSLPEFLSKDMQKLQLKDGVNLESDLAKKLALESENFIEDNLPTNETLATDNSLINSLVSKIISVTEEAGFFIKYGSDAIDFFDGRISAKQFLKNVAVTTAGAAGTALGVASTALTNPIFVFVQGYGGKIFFKEKMKSFLDFFIEDDNKKMMDIFTNELVRQLNGKFLTPFEMGILSETIRDDINKNALKEMYQGGSFEKRKEWAHNYIKNRLEDIFNQRFIVERPSVQDWQDGFQRVLNNKNILEEIEAKRKESIANIQAKLKEYKLKLSDLGSIVSAVNDINKPQLAAERILEKMQVDEQNYQRLNQTLLKRQEDLKDELHRMLLDMEGKNFGK